MTMEQVTRKQMERAILLTLSAMALWGYAGAEPVTAATVIRQPNARLTDRVEVTETNASGSGVTLGAVIVASEASGGTVGIESPSLTGNFTSGLSLEEAEKQTAAAGLLIQKGYTGAVEVGTGTQITLQGKGTHFSGSTLGIQSSTAQVHLGDGVGLTYTYSNQGIGNGNGKLQNGSALYNAGGTVSTGQQLTIRADTGVAGDTNTVGLFNTQGGRLTVGDRADIQVRGSVMQDTSEIIYGIQSGKEAETNQRTWLEMGKNSQVKAEMDGKGSLQKGSLSAVMLWHTDFDLGENLQTGTLLKGWTDTNHGLSFYDAKGTIGEGLNNQVETGAMEDGTASYGDSIVGIKLDAGSQVTLGDGSRNQVTVRSNGSSLAAGIQIVDGSVLDVGNSHRTEVSVLGLTWNSREGGVAGAAVQGKDSLLKGSEGTSFSVVQDGDKQVQVVGLSAQEQGRIQLGDNTTVQVSSAQASVRGISAIGGTNQIGDGARIQAASQSGYAYGTYSDVGGENILGKGAVVSVSSETGAATGIFTSTDSHTLAGDGMTVTAAGSKGIGVYSEHQGVANFLGAARISGGRYSLVSLDNGSLIDLAAEGTKIIDGNMMARYGGAVDVRMDTGDSRFTGASLVADPGSELDLDLSKGARWNMTGDSSVTHLTLDSGAVVNMAANPAYQQLSADTFRGSNGIFYLKTDLDSQTDGDKVHLKEAEDGASGKIQVYDASFARGKEVTGTRHLLLVTDDSGKASFTGETLNQGGLWDVTPTIQNGSYVRDTMGVTDARDTEWYLTKLEKTVNADTRPVLNSGDSVYGFYRLSLDTLRQRRGNLRQRKFQTEDADGLWARNRGGRFSGPGFTSRYNLFQLGYDVHHNPGSVYGFFGERGIASPDYSTGSGREHTLAGGLYGTWYGSHGSYTDVVARVGRDDSHISTWGPYPDKADYRTREQSLSVEYGKTLYLDKDKELFLEPQSQLVLGHLSSTRYTTSRGMEVYREGYNSAIGRLGILIGKVHNEGKHPFDYYGKVSWLHEFGGAQTVAMAARNGETLETAVDHGDSWWEAGFGGTYRFSPKIQGYAEVSRTFSSQIRTKWQVNAGVSWQF